MISFIEMPSIGLSEAQLPNEGSTQDLWHAVLRLVRREGTFDQLVAEVSKQYEKDAELIRKLSPAWRDDREAAPVAINLANPYPGLRPYEEADHERFYGRERWIADLTTALDQHGFVTLYGGSGSGKSSLLRAGLMPRLKKQGRAVILFTPGKNPFESLLAMGLGNRSQAQSLIEQAQKGLQADLFAEIAAQCFPGQNLLVMMDQSEELYTRCESAEVRKCFLDCLFHDRGASTQILIGIREDFFDRWGKTPALSPTFGAANISLTPPDEGDWRAIILEPAQKHGVIFEAGLPEIMIERLRVARAGLPLLQFLLQKLWEHDNPADGVLNQDSYDSLGGIDHALRGHIEAFLKKHAGREGEIRQMLFKLVRFTRQEGQYRALSRSCAPQELPADLTAAMMSDQWRILTTRGQAGEVELSHEVLLRVWPGFEKLEQERGALHTLKGDITDATTRWQPARQKSELWAGSRLEESLKRAGLPGLVDDAKTSDDFALAETPLSDAECEFLQTSRAKVIADRQFQKRMLVGVSVTAAVMLLIAAGAAWFWKEAEAQKKVADTKTKETEQANEANLRNLHDASMADYAVAVQRIEKEGKWNEGLAHLVRSLKWEPGNLLSAARLYSTLAFHGAEKQAWPRKILQHGNNISSAEYSQDGARIVTSSGDNTAKIWDAASGMLIGEPLQHGEEGVSYALFSPDGKKVVTVSYEEKVRFWDATTGKRLSEPLHIAGIHLSRVQFRADGTPIAIIQAETTVQVLDITTGKPLGEPVRHRDGALSAQLSPDGTQMVTASEAFSVQLWDVASSKPLGEPLPQEWAVHFARFSEDGLRLVVSSQETSQVWDLTSRKAIGAELSHGFMKTSAQFSADGTRIVTAHTENTAQVWSVSTGKPVSGPLRHNNEVSSAQFSPDGRRVVTGSGDRTVRVWDAATGKPLGEPLRHAEYITDASFSPDGAQILSVSFDHAAHLWDAPSGKPLGEPLRDVSETDSAQFSRDGRRVVTVDGYSARLWDAVSGKLLFDNLRHENDVTTAQFSPDGMRLVTASFDKTARIWDLRSGKPVGEPFLHIDIVNSAQFSSDGTRIVTASQDKTARIWDAASGKPLGKPMQHGDIVTSAAFSPDGTLIVTASYDKTALIWDAKNGMPLGDALKHDFALRSAQFSPDGKLIATTANGNATQLWDAATRKPLGEPLLQNSEVTQVRFSPDSTRVITASYDKTARVWDTATGKLVFEPLMHETPVHDVCFSSDGSCILTACGDLNTLSYARLWDTKTGKAIGEPMPHHGTVNTAQFSMDGTRIVTAGVDGTARLWDMKSLLPPSTPLPEWMLQRVSATAGLEYDANGLLKEILAAHRLKLLAEPIPSEDPWSKLALWMMQPTHERTLTPESKFTPRQLAERERDSMTTEGLESSLRYDPTVPLSWLLLGEFDVKYKGTFFRDYDIQRLPDDAALWARASKSLLAQKLPEEALKAAQKAVKLDPNLPAAKEALTAAQAPRTQE